MKKLLLFLSLSIFIGINFSCNKKMCPAMEYHLKKNEPPKNPNKPPKPEKTPKSKTKSGLHGKKGF